MSLSKLEVRKQKIMLGMADKKLKELCPNLFATSHAERLSKKYAPINVFKDVYLPLKKLGWEVSDREGSVLTRKSKKDGEHGTFMLRMFNPSFANKERATELLLFASHNGRCSVKFRMGIVEFACANGLVTMSQEVKELKKLKVVHKGHVAERLVTVLDIVANETLKVNKIVHKMKMKILTSKEMNTLALSAIQAKGIEGHALATNPKLYDQNQAIESALQAPQNYDSKVVGQNGKSLYSVFQRIQGAIVKGEIRYGIKPNAKKIQDKISVAVDADSLERLEKQLDIIKNSQPNKVYGGLYQKSTALKGIDSTFKVNADLWSLALEMV